tara:strand:+ start:7028 stop:7234 length:207 start_codon:yes stop_codon:yes gene_type:complete
MKLSLDALKERVEETTSTDLLATISGGIENGCHCIGHQMGSNGGEGKWVNLAQSFNHWLYCDGDMVTY